MHGGSKQPKSIDDLKNRPKCFRRSRVVTWYKKAASRAFRRTFKIAINKTHNFDDVFEPDFYYAFTGWDIW